MTEAHVVQTSALNGMRTDAKIRGPPQWSGFECPHLELRISEDNHTAKWNEKLFSSAANIEGPMSCRSFLRPLWETTFAEFTYITWPKNRKAETARMYDGAIASMGSDIVLRVCDVVGSEFCVSFSDGNRTFEAIRDIISHGKNAIISFEDIRSLSAAFLESAIGRLYNGETSAAALGGRIIWRDVSPSRKLLIERAINEAKESQSKS